MGTLQAPGLLAAVTKVMALSLVALPGTALSQPAPDPGAENGSAIQSLNAWRQRAELADRRLEAIRDEETLNGPHSPALIDQLLSLGMLYQEIGRYELAAESIERALQIKRVNDGLHTFEQAPLIRQLIEVEQSRGNFGVVGQLQARLIRLARLNSDDLRSVRILRVAADRQLGIYTRFLDNELPPQIGITIGGMPGQGFAGNRAFASSQLRQARRNYRGALGVLLDKELYDYDELRELETKLIYTYYLELSEGDPAAYRREALYRQGRQSYQRLAAYTMLGGRLAEDLAKALVELADWDLLFSHNGAALERYREAYDLLAEQGASEATLEEIFSPTTPVPLPAFMPNPLLSEPAPSSKGHLDVAFDVSKYGKSRKVDVVGMEGDADAAPEKEIVQLIARNRFRPKLTDEDASRTSFVLRYHF